MTAENDQADRQTRVGKATVDQPRRATLRRLGRFAAVTPPVVALILSAKSKPAAAITSVGPVSSRRFKQPVSVPQLRGLA
jgi:hypothetical protein